MPKIIVVDGSTAQINTATTILAEHKLHIPVVSVVKNAQHKPERLLGDAQILTTHKEGILLANAEAHRFAVQYHRHRSRRNFTNGSKQT